MSYYYKMPQTPEADRVVAVKPNNTRVVFVSPAEAKHYYAIDNSCHYGMSITIVLSIILVAYKRTHSLD
jgi:hypothetical protein